MTPLYSETILSILLYSYSHRDDIKTHRSRVRTEEAADSEVGTAAQKKLQDRLTADKFPLNLKGRTRAKIDGMRVLDNQLLKVSPPKDGQDHQDLRLDAIDAIDAVETGAGMSAHGYASRKAARAAPTHAPSNPYATKKGASSEEEMADIGSQDRQVHRTSNSSSASSSTSSKLKNKLKSKKKDREEGVRESAKAQVLGKRFDLLAKEVCVFYFPFLALPTRSSGYCFDHPNPVPSFLIYIICPVSSCTYHTIHSSFLVCVNNSL